MGGFLWTLVLGFGFFGGKLWDFDWVNGIQPRER